MSKSAFLIGLLLAAPAFGASDATPPSITLSLNPDQSSYDREKVQVIVEAVDRNTDGAPAGLKRIVINLRNLDADGADTIGQRIIKEYDCPTDPITVQPPDLDMSLYAAGDGYDLKIVAVDCADNPSWAFKNFEVKRNASR